MSGGTGGIWEPCISSQFFCEPRNALKNVYFKKYMY